MNYASTKAPLWLIFPKIFEQWNNHYISNYQKVSLKLPLSPDANNYPTAPINTMQVIGIKKAEQKCSAFFIGVAWSLCTSVN